MSRGRLNTPINSNNNNNLLLTRSHFSSHDHDDEDDEDFIYIPCKVMTEGANKRVVQLPSRPRR